MVMMKYLDITQQQNIFGGNASAYVALFTLSVIGALVEVEHSKFMREKAYHEGFRDGVIKGIESDEEFKKSLLQRIDAVTQGHDTRLLP